jgi:hypothetical protein
MDVITVPATCLTPVQTGISIDVSLAVDGPRVPEEADIVLLSADMDVKHIEPCDGDEPGVLFWLDITWNFPEARISDDHRWIGDAYDPELERWEDFAISNIERFVRLPEGFLVKSAFLTGTYDNRQGYWVREY